MVQFARKEPDSLRHAAALRQIGRPNPVSQDCSSSISLVCPISQKLSYHDNCHFSDDVASGVADLNSRLTYERSPNQALWLVEIAHNC